MGKSKKSLVDRRNFLKGAAAGAAVLVANPRAAVEAKPDELRRARNGSPDVAGRRSHHSPQC
ncbi:MAG: twin-arginine translocation signal domain-containing protein [Candidatus Acidiferrales bacterium]